MKKIGLKYPVAAIYNDSTGAPVYSDGFVIAKAMSAGIQINKNNVKLFADDDIDEVDQSFIDGTITLGLNELPLESQAIMLGHTIGAGGEMVANKNDIAPYMGNGFYGRIKRNGLDKWRAVWLHKVQFGEPNDETETQGQSVVFQTPKIEGVIMKDVNGDWKSENVFDTEAEAKTWLDTKASVSTTASGGLTGLVLTGTGGTLSPAFSAGETLYTFGGVSAASITVKATAANHTLKLYVDDVFTENLTTNVASAAIPLDVGSHKIKVYAQEGIKTPQITEITVVKTT